MCVGVCLKHCHVCGRGKPYSIFLSSFTLPAELKAGSPPFCFAALTLNSWCLFVWCQFTVEDQNTDPQVCEDRVPAGAGCYLINFRASKILIQILRPNMHEKDFFFFKWALCYLSEVQEKSFQQVSVLKWKGYFPNPFKSLLLQRFWSSPLQILLF